MRMCSHGAGCTDISCADIPVILPFMRCPITPRFFLCTTTCAGLDKAGWMMAKAADAYQLQGGDQEHLHLGALRHDRLSQLSDLLMPH